METFLEMVFSQLSHQNCLGFIRFLSKETVTKDGNGDEVRSAFSKIQYGN